MQQNLSDKLEKQARSWLSNDPDSVTRQELETLLANARVDELQDRFAQRLSFGTAGLRAPVGAGPNRMNRLVVLQSTLGLADYLVKTVPDAAQRGVVVGFDGRTTSAAFAEAARQAISARGIRVLRFDEVCATPLVAFAVVRLHAAAGIVITASHNPAADNGYKVYWENGAQIVPPHDTGIAQAIDHVATEPLPEGLQDTSTSIDHAMRTEYLETIAKRAPSIANPKIRAAYTAMHGVGYAPTEALLQRVGYPPLHPVPEQVEPDGTFPTTSFPNPEEPGAMDRVHRLATNEKCDLALAHDPDADRLAVSVRTPHGFERLTGDQLGILLADAVLELGPIPPNPCMGTTIVSSQMLKHMCKGRGVSFFETLTGHKWIHTQAIAHEAHGETFVFGYEEALGYAVGNDVRCKDGISALLCIVTCAEHLANQEKTLFDRLQELYQTYGVFRTRQQSRRFSSMEAAAAFNNRLRKQPPKTLEDFVVTRMIDFNTPGPDRPSYQELPKTNAILLECGNDARILVRPSGTEPKLKSYYEVRRLPEQFSDAPITEQIQMTDALLDRLVLAHQASLN